MTSERRRGRMVEVGLQAVVIHRRADAILASQPRIPRRPDRRGDRRAQRSDRSHHGCHRAQRQRRSVASEDRRRALGRGQRSGPAPAVATASSGWMSTASATPTKHAAPATIRDTTGVAPSVNGTSSPASA